MSRIGKQPVPIPSGVKVEVKNNAVYVQGPKGKLERKLLIAEKLIELQKKAHELLAATQPAEKP